MQESSDEEIVPMRLSVRLLAAVAAVTGLVYVANAQLQDFGENRGVLSDTSRSFIPIAAPKLDGGENGASTLDGMSVGASPLRTDDYPLYRSMQTGSDSRVVAHTKSGDITSKDLYLWLTVADGKIPADIVFQYDRLKTARERKVLAPMIEKAVEDYVWHNQIIPSMSLGTLNEYEQQLMKLRQRVFELPAYQFTYMMKVTKPAIKVVEADRQHALLQNQLNLASGESLQVRYIFIKNKAEDDTSTAPDARAQLDEIRAELVSGKIGFAEAAKQYSQAESAANSGEIPPFFKGQFFFGMENAVDTLTPGQLSEVFPGPGGMYLAQLIKKNPARVASLDDPETAAKVDDIIMTSAMRVEFREQLRILCEKHPVGNLWTYWDDKRPDELLGFVGGMKLTKLQVEQLLPVEDPRDLDSRSAMLRDFLETLLQRENLAKAVEQKGFDCDSDFLKMRKMASNIARKNAIQDKIVCSLNASEQAVRSYYNGHPELFTPMPKKRLVRLTLAPVNIAPTTTATLNELTRIIEGRPRVDDVTPVLPTWDNEIAEELQIVPTDGVTTPVVVETTATAQSENQQTSATTQQKNQETTTVSTEVPAPVHPEGWTTVTAENAGGADNAPQMVNGRKRIEPTKMKDLVSGYQNSDWLLQYDDYGYIYLEEMPKLPLDVASFSVGEFTSPTLVGTAAVSYYLEDERRWPLQPFNAVRAYAYEVYRRAKVNDTMFARRKAGLEAAGIEYSY